jgi:peptidoglycan/LPS O-acetylase OafA/YrhL
MSARKSLGPAASVQFPAIAGLRLAAVFLLVSYHAVLIFPQGDGASLADRLVDRLGAAGWIGTDAFLAIAGFLAYWAMSRGRKAGEWLGRRFLRIFPPYWVFLLAYLWGLPLVMGLAGVDASRLTNYGSLDHARHSWPWLFSCSTNLLFASGTWIGAALEPLLTLAVGVQLFLLGAALFRLPKKAMPWSVLALLAVAYLCRFLWRDDSVWLSYSLPLTRGDAFWWSFLLAWALREGRWKKILLAPSWVLLGGAALPMAAAFLLTGGLNVDNPRVIILGFPAVGLFWAGALLVSVRKNAGGAPELVPGETRRGSAWLTGLGRLAFGAYLIKLPAMDVLLDFLKSAGLDLPVWLFVILSFLLVLLCATVWYWAVERPLSRGSARFSAP